MNQPTKSTGGENREKAIFDESELRILIMYSVIIGILKL